MLRGRVRIALCLLSDHDNGFPLLLDKIVGTKSVRKILLDKHPCGHPLDANAVTPPVPSAFNPHPIYFDHITGSLIRSIALHVDGAVGPSNLGAHCWHCICSLYHGVSANNNNM